VFHAVSCNIYDVYTIIKGGKKRSKERRKREREKKN